MPSIVEAYTAKYEDEEEVGGEDIVKVVFVKRTHFKLQNLILDNSGIDCVGPNEKLKEICCNVRECDLSQNHLQQWTDVHSLLDVVPKLKFLNMSHNPLGAVTSLPSTPHTLNTLILCNTGVEWSSLVNVLQFLPSLKELNIGNNNLSSLHCDTVPDTLPSLQHLNLIKNNFASFTDVLQVSVLFEQLKCLVMSENPLVSFGDTQEAVAQFSSLEQLYVNNITVNSWDEVSKLRWFPALNDVRMVHWDLFGDMPELDRRNMLAALLPTCKLINGAPIEERDAAERWYLRKCQGQGDTTSERYAELNEKHGILPDLADVDLGYGLDETVTVNVVIEDRAINTQKTFSIYEKFGDMKKSLEKEFKTGKSMITVHKPGRDYEGSCGSHDGSQLYRYPVENGDVLYLESWDNKSKDFKHVQQTFSVHFASK